MMTKNSRNSLSFICLGLMLLGCSNPRVDKANPIALVTFTQEYGSGGTRLPNNPGLHFRPGITTKKDVSKLFGAPQIVSSYEWGTVHTYRYWQNTIGQPRTEESYDFVFNSNGFLDEVIQYRNSNAIEESTNDRVERENAECPERFVVCHLYEN